MSSGADELNTAVFLKSGSDQGLVREGVLVILESLAQVRCNVATAAASTDLLLLLDLREMRGCFILPVWI